jgi:hypothetical protein
VDVAARVKKALGKSKAESFVFGFTTGETIDVTLEGDPEDFLSMLIELFGETIELLRKDGAPEEEIREAATEVLAEMKKSLDAPPAGPRLVP